VSAPGDRDLTRELIESQKRFYDLRAPDFLTGAPPDRKGRSSKTPERDARAIIGQLKPTGDVLELGCGPGAFTRELAAHAQSLTAIDSSPRMLARNRAEVAKPGVRYVEADIFAWRPDTTYDLVFFGFLLSHVPPGLFEQFWSLVRACLRPDGRVAFVDEDSRVAHYDEVRIIEGVPTARRTLADGREFDIVKVFWEPAPLEVALRELGWTVSVRQVGDSYLYGVGRYDPP
jgi:SAM-dependent methyltransferase